MRKTVKTATNYNEILKTSHTSRTYLINRLQPVCSPPA
jgi:hypothetical protein